MEVKGLALSLYDKQRITIGEDITIHINYIHKNRAARIVIDAPKHMKIDRNVRPEGTQSLRLARAVKNGRP